MTDPSTHIDPNPRTTLLERSAQILSAVFTPFLVPILAFTWLFFGTYMRIMPLNFRMTVLGVVYIFTILMPLLGIYFFHRLVGNRLKDLTYKEERIVPYLLTLFSYVVCLFLLNRWHLPRYMTSIIVATLMCLVGCTLINFWYKISSHAAASGMLLGGFVSYAYLFQFHSTTLLCVFILLAGMVGSARIIVCQHTLCEVFLGFVLGFVCGVVGILFI